jgi:CRISPR-associated protein Cst2
MNGRSYKHPPRWGCSQKPVCEMTFNLTTLEEIMNRNLFATVLTYAAPSSNYRGESEENRTVMQKITKGGKEYSIISPESMRNALREILISAGLPHNRTRLHNEKQLAVEYKDLPNPEAYADDFLFGYLVAKDEYIKKMKDIPAKRDSVLRMNMAVALTHYRFNAVFHQSPHNGGKSPWKNDEKSNLLHREVAHTAYQYPFALSQRDCRAKQDWTKALLKAISELNEVAGGHARSYYEMAPASIVARLTPSLVAGFDTYGFDDKGGFADLVGGHSRINSNDLPGDEFWIGGEIVRKMDESEKNRLADAGVKLYENPQRLIADLAEAFLK